MSLEALKAHLFETLEGVKNLNDPKADENEKVSLDQAKQIVSIAEAIIDISKVQVEAVATFSKMDNIASVDSMAVGMGIVDEQNIQQLEA